MTKEGTLIATIDATIAETTVDGIETDKPLPLPLLNPRLPKIPR
jgi:hypothetical protein